MATPQPANASGKVHIVDWSRRWSEEARTQRMPTLQSIVSRFAGTQGLIGMHGGLPPPDAFPFTSFKGDLVQLPAPSGSAYVADAGHASSIAQPAVGSVHGESPCLSVTDPLAVATAQQYIMQPKGYPPLQAWAQELVLKLHQPATLPPSSLVGFEVTLTPGASAALDALVRVLINPGDPVLLEEFSYSHHVDAHLLPRGCELLPVSMDQEGLIPAHLDQLLSQRQAAGKTMPRVLYTIPTGQNPTGATMSPHRIQAVYDLARKWDLVVVEDDAYYWLQYPNGPEQVPGLNLKPGFLSIDVDGRVVRVDTFAKLLGPGFRLGWLSGPPPLVSKVSLHLAAVSVGACSLSQVMLHELLTAWGPDGFDAFVRRLQAKYARQALAAQAAAEQHLSGLVEWQPVTAGMFLWMKLSDGSDASFLLDAGAQHKVMVVPGYLTSARHLQTLAQPQLHSQQQQHQQQPQPQPPQQQVVADGNSAPTPISSTEARRASAGAAAAAGEQQQQLVLPPCPCFRVSFASVDAEIMQEGFARLRQAIDSHRSKAAT